MPAESELPTTSLMDATVAVVVIDVANAAAAFKKGAKDAFAVATQVFGKRVVRVHVNDGNAGGPVR